MSAFRRYAEKPTLVLLSAFELLRQVAIVSPEVPNDSDGSVEDQARELGHGSYGAIDTMARCDAIVGSSWEVSRAAITGL
jgi:hypothetical protein